MVFDNTVQHSAELNLDLQIEDFILHHESCRHSPHTILHYRTSLNHLATFTKGLGKANVDELDARSIRIFLGDLQQRFKPKTVHGIASDIRAFLHFLVSEGSLAKSPMDNVPMPKLDKTILPAFTLDEIKTLLKATSGKSPVQVRDRAIILTLLDSGLRVSELLGMKVGDLDQATGRFKVTGKGHKERVCQLSPTSLRSFLQYSRLRRGQAGEPLWCGARGALTRNGVSQILGRIGERTGLHVHPHKFRRTCALMMLRNGADVFSVQYLLGHSDLTVLKRYLQQTQVDYLESHRLNSPVSGISTSN
ncbi:MAG: tyrosine-type recombinase/integrase [Fimbriimonadaceae bacterium]|nr:tyrosine-type recombinase/integrase [Fimbriimonadaceae bacterium]